MSATELEEVQALLERVLPDPRGFAGRLLQQAISQYGQFAEPAATAFYTAVADDITAAETVIVADEWPAGEKPADTNSLLAAALGACECWGLQADCELCRGQGSAGWTQPDPELFEEFIRPAINRMPAGPASGHRRQGQAGAEGQGDDQRTTQGENI
jgi:hypothetical protein